MYEELEQYLSKARLMPYLNLANNNKEKAIDLYKDNIEMSKSFYTLLSYFEIFLRNKIDTTLIKHISKDWFKKIQWKNKHKELIEKVENFEKDDLMSNLSLGFWVYMFDKSYENTLWTVGNLNKLFSKKVKRCDIFKKLNDIRILRNRISHYEIIIKDKNKLKEIYDNILYMIKSINENLFNWIVKNYKIEIN